MLLWKKISKDNLVLTCGVAFLEIEWTIPFLLIAVSIKQNMILLIIKRNKQLSG
jgi:hypothetical protein